MQYRGAAVGITVGALLAVLAGAAKPAEAAWAVGQNFTGSSINDAEGASIPPDTMGAIGPNHFVELLNGRYAVYSKTGAFVEGDTQNDFWRNAGLTIDSAAGSFDPRVQYDPGSGHWFATALSDGGSAASRYLVAVSNTSDPTQGWRAFEFKADPAGSYWADFDMLGLNKDGVYVGANLFGIDSAANLPEQTALLAIDKAGLIAGAPTATLFNNIDPFGAGFTPHPVLNLDNGPTPEIVIGDGLIFNGGRILKGAAVVGPNQGNALNIGGGLIEVANYDAADDAHQPGSDDSISTGDTRLGSSLVQLNGKIWGVHTVVNGSHSALSWFRLDAGTGDVEEEGLIGDSTNDYYYGSIAVNPAGFVAIGYTRSSDTEFASSYASTGFFDGSGTSFDAPLLLKAGTATYDLRYGGDENRWGDYSATTLDPTNPKRFWTIQEWASGDNEWSTQITELIDPIPDPPLTPEPSSLVLLAAGALPLLRRRRPLA